MKKAEDVYAEALENNLGVVNLNEVAIIAMKKYHENKIFGYEGLSDRLNVLIGDEDLTNEKLEIASEGLLPNIADFLNSLRYDQPCK